MSRRWVSSGALVVALGITTAAVGAGHAPRVDTRGASAARSTSGAQLADVSADSRTDAWAVGHAVNDLQQPVMLHWDGQALSPVTSPVGGQLLGVSAISPTDVWVVGSTAPPHAHRVETLVLHWDGSRWSVVPSLNPGPIFNELSAVRALAANDVWAVGSSLDPATHRRKAMVLHWDGRRWSTVSVPAGVARNVLTSGLAALDPLSATSALAVVRHKVHGIESDEILRWNGRVWSHTPPFFGAALSGVSSVSHDDQWAVGYYCTKNRCPPFDTLALHWDGRRWFRAPTSSPGNSHLTSVSEASSTDVWAQGDACSGSCSSPHSLTLRWDGRSWSKLRSPASPIRLISTVSPVSPTDAWAVGSAGQGGGTVLLHWNGTTWAAM